MATLRDHPKLGIASNGDQSVMNEGVTWMERQGMRRWGKGRRRRMVQNKTTMEVVDMGNMGVSKIGRYSEI